MLLRRLILINVGVGPKSDSSTSSVMPLDFDGSVTDSNVWRHLGLP